MAITTFKLTSDNTLVPSTQSNIPSLVIGGNFPAAFWAVVKSDGGDVRVYTDEAKTNQIAHELVDINVGSTTIELSFMVPSLLASVGTDIYVEAGDAAKSMLPVTDTYGRNAVWAADMLSCHMNSTSPVNSTGGTTMTANAVSVVAGKWGNALDFNGTTSDIDCGAMLQGSGDFTYTMWVSPDVLSGFQGIMGDWASADTSTGYVGFDGSQYTFNDYVGGASVKFGSPSTGVWAKVTVARSGSTVYCRVNGAAVTSLTRTGDPPASPNTWLGALESGTNFFLNGQISDVKTTDSYRTLDWDTTEFNNQDDPVAFWGVATVVGAATTILPQVTSNYYR